MQDIVFYVAAGETLGMVRDYSNMNNSFTPVLTLGVSACLRLRLFPRIEVATPYPISSFNNITNWEWSMDADFDRSTACKLVADADGISVHTVTDTVNGETKNFTEFVIPISEMNTIELTTWLGNERMKSGLTGELVGYDSGGNAVFVLQIEDFSVRNRVSGPDAPTAVDEGFVTRTIAEQMIQSAVSSSAATKQDKLNVSNGGIGISVTLGGVISTENVPQSAVSGLSVALVGKQDKLNASNGGTGISVSNAGVISVSDIPQSAVTGLTTSLADISSSLTGKQDKLAAGYRMEIVSGATVAQAKWFPITNATGASVTMQPGEAYKIYATNSTVTINTILIPANQYGLESHLEIFVAGTGYVVTGSNVVLANALEPDAVNNCTVRFHDGLAIISVEDHVAGYIVTVNAASGAGSLAYGLSTATNEYISIDASLNGLTLDLAGATTYAGEKHVVGNGYTETVISGGITCTSKTTFSNLSMLNTVAEGGTMTLGDVFIPSGATVAVSGGGLVIEKVAGDNGTIDLGGADILVQHHTSASAFGCVFTGGSGQTSESDGGAFRVRGDLRLSGCVISGNSAVYGGAIWMDPNYASYARLTDCVVIENSHSYGAIVVQNGNILDIHGGTFGDPSRDISLFGSSALVNIDGTVKMGGGINAILGATGSVNISSGAVLDLTGNTNATPIAPGGGITFASGGATVLVNGGTEATSSSYSMDNVMLPAGAKLKNTAVVDLGGSSTVLVQSPASFSGCVISGGSAAPVGSSTQGGGVKVVRANTTFNNVTFKGNTASNQYGGYGAGGGLFYIGTAADSVTLTSCTFENNIASYGAGAYIMNAPNVFITGCTFGSDQLITLVGTAGITISGAFKTLSRVVGDTATISVSSGAVLDLTGNTNATPIAPGGGVIVYGTSDYENPTTIIGSAGSATEPRGFSARCTITGSAVTKNGAISGATVSLPSSSCQLDILKSGESVVSTVYMQASESPYVVETQQGAGTVLVRVSED